MLAVLIFRLIDAFWWHKSSSTSIYRGKCNVHRYVSGTYLTAILWCLYALIVFPKSGSIELASTIITLAAMAGGGATLLSAHKKTSMAYVLIMLAPASLSLIFSSEDHRQFLGFLGLAFSLAMMVSAKKAADFTAQAIRFKHENALLVNHMEEQVKQRTQRIYELSSLDPLSKLYNRTTFLTRLDDLLKEAEASNVSLAVLFIDLDKFKEINDSMGHDMGDILLKKAAQRLQEQCPKYQLLCRWGGDEFLIALTGTSQQQAKDIAYNLIDEISLPYTINNNHCVIGATIGIAMYPQHATSANQLIQLADIAMYHQKNIKPSHVEVFSPLLSKQLARDKKLKQGLENAIAKEQFTLYFQPIISTCTNETTSCEALLRWNLDGENISPVEFIPLAEQYGYIIKIGEWVLKQACLVASQWPTQQAVAVNVSVLQLQDKLFIDVIDAALASSQLAPEKLHIEITESVFASDKATLLQRIRVLQGRGIKVSIDDFGTEYSSLSVIQDLGVNILKIDRSFVQQLDGNGYAIISAIVQIASALNYKVVAEGVEHQRQAEKLTAMGVDYLQGFLFAKPMNSAKLTEYLSMDNKKAP